MPIKLYFYKLNTYTGVLVKFCSVRHLLPVDPVSIQYFNIEILSSKRLNKA
uniref:Uncharacterized protein n=1 Tax=Rhizophora mucronata TaxID=61149 RepID=A0A2P2IZB5_RHIMU